MKRGRGRPRRFISITEDEWTTPSQHYNDLQSRSRTQGKQLCRELGRAGVLAADESAIASSLRFSGVPRMLDSENTMSHVTVSKSQLHIRTSQLRRCFRMISMLIHAVSLHRCRNLYMASCLVIALWRSSLRQSVPHIRGLLIRFMFELLRAGRSIDASGHPKLTILRTVRVFKILTNSSTSIRPAASIELASYYIKMNNVRAAYDTLSGLLSSGPSRSCHWIHAVCGSLAAALWLTERNKILVVMSSSESMIPSSMSMSLLKTFHDGSLGHFKHALSLLPDCQAYFLAIYTIKSMYFLPYHLLNQLPDRWVPADKFFDAQKTALDFCLRWEMSRFQVMYGKHIMQSLISNTNLSKEQPAGNVPAKSGDTVADVRAISQDLQPNSNVSSQHPWWNNFSSQKISNTPTCRPMHGGDMDDILTDVLTGTAVDSLFGIISFGIPSIHIRIELLASTLFDLYRLVDGENYVNDYAPPRSWLHPWFGYDVWSRCCLAIPPSISSSSKETLLNDAATHCHVVLTQDPSATVAIIVLDGLLTEFGVVQTAVTRGDMCSYLASYIDFTRGRADLWPALARYVLLCIVDETWDLSTGMLVPGVQSDARVLTHRRCGGTMSSAAMSTSLSFSDTCHVQEASDAGCVDRSFVNNEYVDRIDRHGWKYRKKWWSRAFFNPSTNISPCAAASVVLAKTVIAWALYGPKHTFLQQSEQWLVDHSPLNGNAASWMYELCLHLVSDKAEPQSPGYFDQLRNTFFCSY